MLVLSATADDDFTRAIPVDSDQPVVSTVSLHPHGKWLVTAGDDHVVRIWDLPSGTQIRQIPGHTDWVRSSSFIPNSTQVLTAGDDGHVHLLDIVEGTLERKVTSVDFSISRLKVAPNGSVIAISGFSKNLFLIDTQSGNVLHKIDALTDDVRGLSFSNSGKVIASGGRDGIVRLWSVDTGQQVGEIMAHRRRVRDMCFISDDSMLVSISDDRTMFVADLENAAESHRVPLGAILPFALVDCGNQQVAVGGTDNRISIWNLKEQSIRKVFQGHTGSITSLDYVTRPGGLGGVVVSGSFDTSVRTWPLGPLNPVRVRVSEKSPAATK